jgi:CDP-diacylglycerol---serine O-phosphatidyltransferase
MHERSILETDTTVKQTMKQRFMRRRNRPPRRGPQMDKLKKGVYILPNFLTSLSLFCGFYAIVSTMRGDYLQAAWAIIVSGLFDGLDGRIARMTNTTSKFGVEYDSLADLVAFGVAPAVLAYGWVLSGYGRWGWVAAFLYVACGAIRLARFNVQSVGSGKGNYFTGLPIPAAAGMVATTIIFCFHMEIADKAVLSILFIGMIYVLAFFMVSTIRFQSFKQFDFRSRKPFNAVILAILLIYIVASEPQIMLFAMGLTYVLSGPLGYGLYMIKKSRTRGQETVVTPTEEKDGSQKTIR